MPGKKKYLNTDDVAFTTGAFVFWNGHSWELDHIDETRDLFYDGELVNDRDTSPYTEE
jgi:hypothetical protein